MPGIFGVAFVAEARAAIVSEPNIDYVMPSECRPATSRQFLNLERPFRAVEAFARRREIIL